LLIVDPGNGDDVVTIGASEADTNDLLTAVVGRAPQAAAEPPHAPAPAPVTKTN